jgi:hypothetical protein
MKFIVFLFFVFVMAITACKKEAGEGGQASITGKVWMQEWIGTYHDSTNDHWATERDIYIIYGNDVSYGNHTKTGFDGLYEFQYLREGDYTVYVYSDSTTILKTSIKKVISTSGKGTSDAGIFTIKKMN